MDREKLGTVSIWLNTESALFYRTVHLAKSLIPKKVLRAICAAWTCTVYPQ